MKSLFILIIGTVVAGIIMYRVTVQESDIVYVLSEPVADISSDKNENVQIQQIEIKNIGNAETERIRILIKVPVISFEVSKHSQADIPESYPTKNSFELIYPKLPPQATFKLITKSIGIKNAPDSLEISHKNGMARNALQEKRSRAETISNISLLLVYLGAMLYVVRRTAIDNLELKIDYSYDELLKMKRPSYISGKKWYSIRKRALEYKLSKYKQSYGPRSPEELGSFKVLSSPKPDYLSEEEWQKLKKESEEAFIGKLSQMATEAYESSQVLRILNCQRPENLKPDDWKELREAKLSRIYLMLRKSELLRLDNISRELHAEKPQGLPETTWSDLIEYCKNRFFQILSQDIEEQNNPIEYLNKHDLDVLDKNRIDILRHRAYQLQLRQIPDVLNPVEARKFLDLSRPNWMKAQDYDRLRLMALNSSELEIKLKKNEKTYEIFKALSETKALPKKKPELFNDEEWNVFTELDKNLRALKEINLKRENDLKEKEDQVRFLKEKVEKQLNTINKFLTDNTVLDRIEEYDNFFAPGNLKNLKNLAELMKKHSQLNKA